MARGKTVPIPVVTLAHAEGLPLPAYQTDGAAGLDLVAAVPAKRPIMLKRGAIAMVPTGLSIELPPGFEAQVRPRSGLAAKNGVTVLNAPGTIDEDYRGEVQVVLINHGKAAVSIERGMRIAQMVVAPVTRARLVPAKSLSKTARGAGGHGSTGLASTRSDARSAKSKRK